jgi:hypothetical protein
MIGFSRAGYEPSMNRTSLVSLGFWAFAVQLSGCQTDGARAADGGSWDGPQTRSDGSARDSADAQGRDAWRSDAQRPTGCSSRDVGSLARGSWTNVGPTPWPEGICATGLALDPCDRSTLYIGSDGIYRSRDGGGTWERVGRIVGEPVDGQMDGSNHIRIDPNDPQHLYATSGVAGGFLGFWVSRDGGETFSMPLGFKALHDDPGLQNHGDLYDVAVDPSDFDHLLVTGHNPWGDPSSRWLGSSGVLESQDGGDSWIVHAPAENWGTGHSIAFLYDPERGIGDSSTWLLSTQYDGRYRTTDSGASWTRVSDTSTVHGGGTVLRASDGSLYAGGQPGIVRSTDNGASWTVVSDFPSRAVTEVEGRLYSGVGQPGDAPFHVAALGTSNWSPFNEQTFREGPFQFAFDDQARVLYSTNCVGGVWALAL